MLTGWLFRQIIVNRPFLNNSGLEILWMLKFTRPTTRQKMKDFMTKLYSYDQANTKDSDDNEEEEIHVDISEALVTESST